MADTDGKQRRYLHPVQLSGNLRRKDYHVKSAGTTPAGWKIQAIEAKNPAVSGPLRYGALVEIPGQEAKMVFGNFQEIAELEAHLKEDIGSVEKSLRMLGPSKVYSLNDHMQTGTKTHVMPSRDRAESYQSAQQMYPSQDDLSAPRTQKQEEEQALKAHLDAKDRERNPSPFIPSTKEDRQWHQERLAATAAAPVGTTLVTAPEPPNFDGTTGPEQSE